MTARIIKTLVKEFSPSPGYILDFNKSTLADFIYESITVDILEPPYEQLSMAKILTQVLTIESDELTDKLINDLRKYNQ